MKLQASEVMIGLLTIASSLIYGDNLQPYANQIIEIKEIAGVHNYTLILECSNIHPIVSYAPESFAQSQDDSIHRFLLPNTTLLYDLENELGYVKQRGSAVEVYLFGRLVLHTVDSGKIVFVVLLDDEEFVTPSDDQEEVEVVVDETKE